MAVSDRAWGSITQADYTLEQWARACLIHLEAGRPTAKGMHKLPVRMPDGVVSRGGAYAAASVLAGGRGGVDAPPEKKRTAARELVSIYRNQLEEDPPESLVRLARD